MIRYIRTILDDKREVAILINKTLKMKNKIKEENLEKYNSSFITSTLKNQESDIVYKLKNKKIFFLIEHQSKIDYSMPLRILEYENEIMRSAIDYEKIGQKKYTLPLVIPIVLYTGSKKWNANTYIGEIQENLEGYEQKEFARFKVIDINNYNKEELLKEKSINSKLILLEKAQNNEILAKYLEEISEEVSNNKFYSKKQKEILITIIELIFKRKIGKEKAEEIINKLKGGEEEMLAVLEMIDRDNKRIRNQGIKDGMKKQKIKMIKKLKELNYPEEEIQKIMELSQEEINKLI